MTFLLRVRPETAPKLVDRRRDRWQQAWDFYDDGSCWPHGAIRPEPAVLEPHNRFGGRPLVSSRWDPTHPRRHVCAFDGCGCDYKMVDRYAHHVSADKTAFRAIEASHCVGILDLDEEVA